MKGPYRLLILVFTLEILLVDSCHKVQETPQIQNPYDNPPCFGHVPESIYIKLDIPESGAVGQSINPTLRWVSYNDSSWVTFDIFFGKDSASLPLISANQGKLYITLHGLELNTKYYWRVNTNKSKILCKSNSSAGSSFTTVPNKDLPFIITAPVLTHVYSPPRVGGKVIYEGSSQLIERGVYCSLTPGSENTGTKFHIGNNMGLFSDLLPGLNPSSTYYIKAYATNSSGTSLGAELTFGNGSNTNFKTVNDIEGNIYYTVDIGTQNWMSENLRSTKFNDGTTIPNVLDSAAWFSLTTPGYCWYTNEIGLSSTYGALYNWFSVDSLSNGNKNVCPVGWHVPSDDDWNTLINYLGGRDEAGRRLKEPGDYYWWYPRPYVGNNESNFCGLAAGQRSPASSQFNSREGSAFWRSSSKGNSVWVMTGDNFADLSDVNNKTSGLSVRCIKDNQTP